MRGVEALLSTRGEKTWSTTLPHRHGTRSVSAEWVRDAVIQSSPWVGDYD